MAYTALTLINKSYYLSQIVSRELQTVSGVQIADGLELLNDLLDVKSSDLRLIPYFTYDSFPTVAGQELYYLPNVLQIDSLTFNLGDVRFPMREMSRREYFATGRVDNIQSLPWSYRQERVFGGTDLYLYFEPSQVFTVKYMAKLALTDVTLTQDLSLTYDRFYIEYLRYALAEYICLDYGQTFPEATAAKFAEIRKKLMDISPSDLRIQKKSYFNTDSVIDWQYVNIPGWLP